MIETGECEFSPCRTYRYTLWRELGDPMVNMERPIGAFLTVIGLNPSTADEKTNDRTVARCIDYAGRWGFRILCMMNIFAFRSTDPAVLPKLGDPVGPDNLEWLQKTLITCQGSGGFALAAWGAHGVIKGQGEAVKRLAGILKVPLYCLGTTKGGYPRHPLYLKADLLPARFS